MMFFPWCIASLSAQLVQVIPEAPTAEDTVTIIFNAKEGNQVLRAHQGPVYLHTGVILGTADEPSGWRYVQGEWGTDDSRMKMQRIGPDLYQIRFHIRSFYGFPVSEPFLQLSFVFRNQNGSLVAKDLGDADIYYPELEVFKHGTIELSHGDDGQGINQIQGIELRPDGSIVFRDEIQALLLRNFGNKSLQLAYFPTGQVNLPPSEAVIASHDLWPEEVNPYGSGPVKLAWGDGYTLVFARDPFAFHIESKNQIIWAWEKGFFLDEGEATVGTISGLRTRLQPDESLYGTGSRAIDLDRRGKRLYTYNTASYGYTLGEEDLNISIPFVLSSAGYGLYMDSYRNGYFDLGFTHPDILEYGNKDSLVSCFFIPNPEPLEILREYTRLTGTQPLPPRWALGYIQSRFGYKSQAELEDIVRKTRTAGYPLDAVLLDLYWFGGKGQMGDLDWDTSQFPDPDGMIDRLQGQGIQTILISESYFVEGTRHYETVKKQGLLAQNEAGEPFIIPDFWAGPAGLLDVFQPQAGDWFWPLYKTQLDRGVAAWWCDSGEPENHPKSMHHVKGKAEAVHNLYNHYWAKLLYEHFTADFPEKRFLNLSRSGFAGMQRYATFPWSGDVSRNWDALRAQPMIMLGAGLCGIGYMHSDLGGFTGGPKNPELFQRWIQLGAFSPVMRVHGDAEGIAPEPIFYDNQTQEGVRKMIKLRYQFLPYNYTLAYENSQAGTPLARPLWFHYPNDPQVRNESQAYLWGKDLLVYPLSAPGQDSASIYLPEGNWINYHTEERLKGRQSHFLPVPAETLPLFVREGAFLPLSSQEVSYTGEMDELTLDLHDYLPRKSSPQEGYLYWDDGQSAKAVEQESFQMLHFSGQEKGKNRLIHIEETHAYGGPGVDWINLYLHQVERAPKKIKLNGKTHKVAPLSPNDLGIVQWDAQQHILKVRFPFEGEPVSIQMKK